MRATERILGTKASSSNIKDSSSSSNATAAAFVPAAIGLLVSQKIDTSFKITPGVTTSEMLLNKNSDQKQSVEKIDYDENEKKLLEELDIIRDFIAKREHDYLKLVKIEEEFVQERKDWKKFVKNYKQTSVETE